MDNRPIGVFDSGIGGLTVLKELIRGLPNENIVYFGDTARVPYGTRSRDIIIKYTFQSIRFLLSKNIKALVIACNTASAIAMPEVKRHFLLPVIGVIGPGAAAAVSANRNGRIGVIGTPATIESGAYKDAIEKVDGSKEIISNSCPLFVPLVEEGWSETEVASIVAREYLKPVLSKNVDTLVMGCTHYPLLKKVVGDIAGNKVTLIDPACETAKEFIKLLKGYNLAREDKGSPVYRYYVSDDPEKFVKVGARFLERKIDNIEKIDIEKY
ncbi:MAG: glutamate racemase [Clostridiales bacterium]|nr:glutamate racemase [Clostridiales bacterium]HBM79704.1 glutamate racemase [Clostridiaceae bacterium]